MMAKTDSNRKTMFQNSEFVALSLEFTDLLIVEVKTHDALEANQRNRTALG